MKPTILPFPWWQTNPVQGGLLLLAYSYSSDSSTVGSTCHIVLGTSKHCCIALSLILSTSSNHLPSKVILIQGKRKKSHGGMYGKYRGWCKCGIWCLAKNYCTSWASCAKTMLWQSCHTWNCHFLCHTWQTTSFSCLSTFAVFHKLMSSAHPNKSEVPDRWCSFFTAVSSHGKNWHISRPISTYCNKPKETPGSSAITLMVSLQSAFTSIIT